MLEIVSFMVASGIECVLSKVSWVFIFHHACTSTAASRYQTQSVPDTCTCLKQFVMSVLVVHGMHGCMGHILAFVVIGISNAVLTEVCISASPSNT